MVLFAVLLAAYGYHGRRVKAVEKRQDKVETEREDLADLVWKYRAQVDQYRQEDWTRQGEARMMRDALLQQMDELEKECKR